MATAQPQPDDEAEDDVGDSASVVMADPGVASSSGRPDVAAASAGPVTGEPRVGGDNCPFEEGNVWSRLAPDSVISRSCSYVKGLGKPRMSECLEVIDPDLDAATTAALSKEGQCCLLWVYTRIRPNIAITDLRILVSSKFRSMSYVCTLFLFSCVVCVASFVICMSASESVVRVVCCVSVAFSMACMLSLFSYVMQVWAATFSSSRR